MGAAGCGGKATVLTDTGVVSDGSVVSDASTTDISGWYQVSSYLAGACGMTMPSALLAPDYLWVEHQMIRYVFRVCSGTTASTCTGTAFYDFTQPIESGWRAQGGTAFFSAGCTLNWERTDATLVGSELRANSLKYSINKDIPQAQCTLAAAAPLTEPCTYQVDLVATRL